MGFLDWHYYSVVRADLISTGRYKNCMELPMVRSLKISSGGSSVVKDTKVLVSLICLLELLTGKRPLVYKARKSVSSFKVRQGMLMGCSVVLRNHNLCYDFLQKGALSVAYRRWLRNKPKGLLQSVSTQGNLSFGFSDSFFFPQMDTEFDKFQSGIGGNINISTSCKNKWEGCLLFALIGLPIR